MSEKGILYGLGVGPGDPELMTLKACRILNENRYIAIPSERKEICRSYMIAEPVMDDPGSKEVIACHVKMTKDMDILMEGYRSSAKKITDILDRGENVVYLTLGDPTIYASYIYIHQIVREAGYRAEIISGIPSFCAAAARLGISLCERSEEVHIIPSSYDIDRALDLPGVKVLMKAAGSMPRVREKLMQMDAGVFMVENCGMEDERVFMSAEEIDSHAGYLSLMIVKDKKQKEMPL